MTPNLDAACDFLEAEIRAGRSVGIRELWDHFGLTPTTAALAIEMAHKAASKSVPRGPQAQRKENAHLFAPDREERQATAMVNEDQRARRKVIGGKPYPSPARKRYLKPADVAEQNAVERGERAADRLPRVKKR